MSRPAASGEVRVRVPAKVNLHLGVGDPRPDGYHELVTVFHAVGLWDEVVAAPGDGLSVSVSGPGADDVPTDERNLAWKAAALLAEAAGIAPDVHLEIAKDIPVAGGMAGGSADAAAALVACRRLWQLNISPDEVSALAAQLGSDVAFPLLGGTALGTGRGEVLTPVRCATRLHWVFALADFGVSAAAAYRELDRQRAAGTAAPPAGPPESLLAALAGGDAAAIGAALTNDLQPAALALAPQLADTLAAGRVVDGVLGALVSGSGPTCAFLCRDPDTATLVAATLESTGTCARAATASSPAGGAGVLGRVSG